MRVFFFAGLFVFVFALAVFCGGGRGFAAESEDSSPARGLPVVEMFSSRACMFCPLAERFLGDLVHKGKAHGLTCMVDYFQTRAAADNPASALCVRRQESYARSLKSGPLYTPQAVIDGVRDAVGYRQTEIEGLLEGADFLVPEKIGVQVQEDKAGGAGKGISLDLPALAGSGKEDSARPLSLQIFVYRKKARESGPQARPLTNLVRGIESAGEWDGKAGARMIPLPSAWAAEPDPENRGLAVLAVDSVTHAIVAAGFVGEDINPAPQNIDAGE